MLKNIWLCLRSQSHLLIGEEPVTQRLYQTMIQAFQGDFISSERT